MSLLNDRFSRGFIAGLIGYIPLTIFNQILYGLKVSSIRYLDFAAVFIYGHKPENTLEALFAYFVVTFFTASLGIVFAYLVSFISPQYILLKGAIFASGAWFIFYAVTILFDVPEISHADLASAISNFLGAVFWGTATAYALKWLDLKEKRKVHGKLRR